jgi:hypothetical protein
MGWVLMEGVAVSRNEWTGAADVVLWGKCVGTMDADADAEGLEEGEIVSGGETTRAVGSVIVRVVVQWGSLVTRVGVGLVELEIEARLREWILLKSCWSVYDIVISRMLDLSNWGLKNRKFSPWSWLELGLKLDEVGGGLGREWTLADHTGQALKQLAPSTFKVVGKIAIDMTDLRIEDQFYH